MSTNPSMIGRFKVVNRLGGGGMGTLFLAHDPAIDRMLAIKVLREGFDDEELRARFAREARAAGRLRHPNIVTIFDVGEYDGQPYIAMEYVPGETLGSLIQRQARLPLSRQIKLLEELCDGLAYAHRNGLVHRDIKPANLMIDAEGMLKILDFGIVRVAESGMTQKDALVGTVPYMSPEQAGNGRPVDHRSDIFAVGDVSYELFTGRQAFPGSITDGVFDRIKVKEPPPLAEVRPNLPQELVRVVARAMEKDPDKRYQDLVAMRTDLARVRERVQRDDEHPTTAAEPEGPTLPGGRGARPGTSRRAAPSTVRPPEGDSVAKRRVARIAQHLEQAKQALEGQDFEQAIAAAEEAALLDPGCEPAHQIIDEANRGIEDRQVKQWLSQARDGLNRGDPTVAAELVDQALALKPASPEAQSLHKAIEDVRRELEMARERAQVVLEAVGRARAHLAEGAFELAIRAADEALTRQPDHPEAVEIRGQAAAGLEEERRRAALNRGADEAIDTARREFAARHYDAALAHLDQFAPPHERVTAARRDLREQIAAVRAAEEEARTQKVAALGAAAQQAADAGKYDQALGLLGRIRELDSQSATAAALTKEILRRKAEGEQAARNREKAKAAIDSVRRSLEQRDLAAAQAAVEEALALDPQSDAARALQDTVRKQQSLVTAHLEAARQALAAERVQDAQRELEQAETIDPNSGPLKQLQAETATVAAAIAARAQQREQAAREADDRRQREQRESEERRLRQERAAEERRLQQERAAEENRIRAELEAQERRDAELAARGQKVANGIEKARKKSSPAAALAILRPLAEISPDHAELLALIGEQEAELQRRLAEPPSSGRGWNPAYLGIAALAVAALAGGIWTVTRSDPDPAPQEATDAVAGGTTPPAASPGAVPPAIPLPPQAAAAPSPVVQPPAAPAADILKPVASKPTASPSDTTARLEVELAPIRQRARQQFEAGQPAQALTTAQQGLKIKADDAEIRSLLDTMVRRASAESASARAEASAAEASTSAASPFERASQQLRSAESDQRAGRLEPALRNFWAARDSFREATTQAGPKGPVSGPTVVASAPRPAPAGDPPPSEPPPTAPPPPAPPPPAVALDPSNAIRQTLRAYEGAFSSMSLASVQQVQALTETQDRQIKAAFDAAREYLVEVRIQNIALAPDGRRATVNAQVRRAFSAKVGSGRNDVVVPTVFTLEPRGGAWIIVNMK